MTVRQHMPTGWNFTFALLFLAMPALLAGCGRDREDEILFAADDAPVTITYVTPNNAILSVPEQAAIDRFQERAPGIEIDRRPFQRNAAGYLLDTPPPDVMLLWNGDVLRNAAIQGLLSDLSDIWSENNLSDAYGERFRDIGRIDGTLRFVPAGFTWTGFYYNKEVFERYGLSPPRTWDEFMRICDTLLANGETPLSLAGQNPFSSNLWFEYLNMRMNGPEFHRRLMAGQESYSDERVARVWEQWLVLLEGGYFTERPGSVSGIGSMTALIRGDAETPLNNQKAVMTLSPHFSLSDLPPLFQKELDFFQFPQMDASLPIGEVAITFGFVIPADATNRAEAAAFVGYMGSAEAQELQLQMIGEEEGHAGFVPVHQGIERALLSSAAQKGEQIVRSADEVRPPLFLSIPDAMQAGFSQVLRRLFLVTDTSLEIGEIQAILEEARQRAVQDGEYGP